MALTFDLGNNASNVQRGLFVPTKILEGDLLSVNESGKGGSSEASFCFVQQQFSSELQAFMINYVISVSGPYSVYA